MIRTMLKSKISSVKITDSNLFYEGSIGIDLDIPTLINVEELELSTVQISLDICLDLIENNLD